MNFHSYLIKLSILFFLSFLIPSFARDLQCEIIEEAEAIAAADIWYAMDLNDPNTKMEETEKIARLKNIAKKTVFYIASGDELLNSLPNNRRIYGYIVSYKPSGFIMVSGEERIDPILVFGWKSNFRWDCPERNYFRVYVREALIGRWKYLDRQLSKGIKVEEHPQWKNLRRLLKNKISLTLCTFDQLEGGRKKTAGRYVHIELFTPHWGQGSSYNQTVIANNGNIPGIPTGCVATAMAMKMWYHKWPNNGAGRHIYDDFVGEIPFHHDVIYSNHTYSWSNMPGWDLSSPNEDVCDLMYHCGVAVNMNYEIDESGAYTADASGAMEEHFGYLGNFANTSNHELDIIKSIQGGLPVLCRYHLHSWIVDGFRSSPSPFFRINYGMNGDNNDWYNLDELHNGNVIAGSYPYSHPSNWVYTDKNDGGSLHNGWIAYPYITVADGIDGTPNGGQLWIKEGTYNETGSSSLVFDKKMIIRNYEGTVIID